MGNLVWLLGVVSSIWVIYNVWNDPRKSNEQKLIWTVCAVLLSVVTAVAYYLLEKKKVR